MDDDWGSKGSLIVEACGCNIVAGEKALVWTVVSAGIWEEADAKELCATGIGIGLTDAGMAILAGWESARGGMGVTFRNTLVAALEDINVLV